MWVWIHQHTVISLSGEFRVNEIEGIIIKGHFVQPRVFHKSDSISPKEPILTGLHTKQIGVKPNTLVPVLARSLVP